MMLNDTPILVDIYILRHYYEMSIKCLAGIFKYEAKLDENSGKFSNYNIL